MNKQGLIAELKKRNVERTKTDKFDNLRSELRAIVKAEIEAKRVSNIEISDDSANRASASNDIPEKDESNEATANLVVKTASTAATNSRKFHGRHARVIRREHDVG